MEIHWHHMSAVPVGQRQALEARLRALGAEHGDLVDVRIAGQSSRHHRQGDRRVRIAAQTARKEIIAARTARSLGLAADEALGAFERELRKLRSRRHDHACGSERALPLDPSPALAE